MPGSSEKEETKAVLMEKLQENGQLGKIRAMVMEHSIASFNEKSSGTPANSQAKLNSLFLSTPELGQFKATEDGKECLALVHDLLKSLGLVYTSKVLEAEASMPVSELPARPALEKKFGTAEKHTPVLCGAVKGTVAPIEPPPPKPAPDVPEREIHEDVPKPAPDVPNRRKPVPKPGAKDTPYYICKYNDGDFYRHNQVAGQQVAMEELEGCKIFVLDAVDSIVMDDCINCELVVASCEGSIFIRDCNKLKITAACKQFRTRDCHDCDLNLFVQTDPVIEKSHAMRFRPFNASLPALKKRFQDARLDPKLNRFVHVYDFTADDPKIPKPHSEVFFPDHGLKMISMCETFGTPEHPPEVLDLLQLRMMPAPSSESGQNKSYNIKTGAAVWSGAGTTAAPTAAAEPQPAAPPQGVLSRDEDSEEFDSYDEDDDEF